jgi:hypothetical protein
MPEGSYIVVALAMCCLIAVAIDRIRQQNSKQVVLSMMDLKEFKDLPVEFRGAIRKVLPDPVHIRQQWKHLTPDQKRMVIQQVSGVIPQPRHHHHHHEPEPPAPVPEPPAPVPELPAPSAFKKGFLLKQNKKKGSKNKEHDEVITLGRVGADEEADSLTPDDRHTSFLGSDD